MLIHYMCNKGCDITITSSMSSTILRLCAWCLVDDTDIPSFCNGPNDSEEEIILRLQRAVSIWEGGLRSTGGALTVIKSFCTFSIYRWKLDGTHFYGDPSSATQLYLTPDGAQDPIDTLHPDTAKEVMGVW